jgi:Na+-transporting NADH:ubiquinone oxidoreductase subunit F
VKRSRARSRRLGGLRRSFTATLRRVPLVTVPIVDILSATPRSRLVRFALHGQPLSFEPGQALMVGAHEQAERRPYSIASSPEQTLATGNLELLISVEPDGSLGTNFGSAARGSLVDVEGPIGSFMLPTHAKDSWVLFVAGGAGIAPLRAMIDHLLRTGPAHRTSLLYSARRADEFAFIEELRAHSAAGLLELHQTVTRDDSPTWTGPRGRIGPTHFEAVLHEPEATLCFVCGPDAFVKESVATITALGVPESQIRTESWGR